MRIVFHGLLRDLFGPEFRIEANSVADAVDGYARQQPLWPREMRIAVVGFDTPELLFGEKPDEIHVMPALQGGGGKFGSIIMGAVVFAVGAALTFLVPGMQTVGISLMVSGAMMMVQGVIGLFMKAPKMKNTEDPEDSKYFGVSKNTTKARTPITMAYGRVNLYPHWLSLQVDSNNLSHGSFPTTTS